MNAFEIWMKKRAVHISHTSGALSSYALKVMLHI